MLSEEITMRKIRARFGSNPKFCPLRTSTISNKHETKNIMINNRDSPIIVKIVCLLFERGINPNVLVPRMGNVGYFQRYFHVMSLFQVSKELHLNFVDILRPNLVLGGTAERKEG
jgi:hypothetical protein